MTIVIYTYYPVFFESIKNTSEFVYSIFIFLIFFIFIHFTHNLYCFTLCKIKDKKDLKQKDEEDYKKSMENLWKFVDGLPLKTKKSLKSSSVLTTSHIFARVIDCVVLELMKTY